MVEDTVGSGSGGTSSNKLDGALDLTDLMLVFRSLLTKRMCEAALLLLSARGGEGDGHGGKDRCVALLSPAGRGGEGGNQGDASLPYRASWSWCCSLLWIRSRYNLPRLPSLICGRTRSFDGGSFLNRWLKRIRAVSVCRSVVMLAFLLVAMVAEEEGGSAKDGGLRRRRSAETYLPEQMVASPRRC